MSKPVLHDDFNSMVQQVASGNLTSLVLCVDDNKETFMVQLGQCKVLSEKYTNETINQITENELYKLEDMNSLPFQVDFFIPIVKVSCGEALCALLTSEGQVHTWGNN